MIPAGTDVPSDIEIDVTDPALYAACGVSLPNMCESQISATSPTPSSAPGVVATPLAALLLALIAKLAVY